MAEYLFKNEIKCCYSEGYSQDGNCPFCFIDIRHGEHHCSLSECKCLKTKRPDDCPLVELPPCSCIIKADDVPVYSNIDGDYIFKKDIDEHTIYKNYEE